MFLERGIDIPSYPPNIRDAFSSWNPTTRLSCAGRIDAWICVVSIRRWPHTVTSNIAAQNSGPELEMVEATGSRVDRNRGEKNRGFGITDDSTGGGTGRTANTFTLNLFGWASTAGLSSPFGLCR